MPAKPGIRPAVLTVSVHSQSLRSVIQSFIHVQLFVTHGPQHTRPPCPSPAPGVCSNSCIELVMPSNHLILCRPLLLVPSIFPSIRIFSNESVLRISGQSIGVLPMNIQEWFHLGLTRWTFVDIMSLLFNKLSRLVITFLPRSKRLLISWLQSPSAAILEPPKNKSATVSTVSPLFAMKWWGRMHDLSFLNVEL